MATRIGEGVWIQLNLDTSKAERALDRLERRADAIDEGTGPRGPGGPGGGGPKGGRVPKAPFGSEAIEAAIPVTILAHRKVQKKNSPVLLATIGRLKENYNDTSAPPLTPRGDPFMAMGGSYLQLLGPLNQFAPRGTWYDAARSGGVNWFMGKRNEHAVVDEWETYIRKWIVEHELPRKWKVLPRIMKTMGKSSGLIQSAKDAATWLASNPLKAFIGYEAAKVAMATPNALAIGLASNPITSDWSITRQIESLRNSVTYIESYVKTALDAVHKTMDMSTAMARVNGKVPNITIGYGIYRQAELQEDQLKRKMDEFKQKEVAAAVGESMREIFKGGINK
jgi:hypothetical protein